MGWLALGFGGVREMGLGPRWVGLAAAGLRRSPAWGGKWPEACWAALSFPLLFHLFLFKIKQKRERKEREGRGGIWAWG